MNIFIHVCRERYWYVQQVLIPELVKQGIPSTSIDYYYDENNEGNLKAFMRSCEKCIERFGVDSSVWHLQDDVYPCSLFKDRAEVYQQEADIVCGFTCRYKSEIGKPGKYNAWEDKMWFSFPCILIPNTILAHMVDWQNPHLWRNPYFREYVLMNKGDDLVFKEFVYHYYPNLTVLNLAPNLVEHIDYLLGGSVANKQRMTDTTSAYWLEPLRIKALEDFLKNFEKRC